MILCHSLKIIFLKTKKVGGSSFEIALSKFCDEGDIITPMTQKDELIRESFGFQKPINYLSKNRLKINKNQKVVGDFFNHIESRAVCHNLGKGIFNSYTKVSIHRNPLDFLISQYFFKNRNILENNRVPFKDWLKNNHKNFEINFKIAPKSGPFSADVILRYEKINEDIDKTKLFPNQFGKIFSSINAKGNLRPPASRNSMKFFQDSGCADYIPIIIKSDPNFADEQHYE